MRSPEQRAAIEARLRELCDAGEREQAATELLEAYGREIFAFLMSRLRDQSVAEDVFSRFMENLWRGLPDFQWLCSARVWAYTLARHAASHHLRDVRRRRPRNLPLSLAGTLSKIEAQARTDTARSARTGARSQIVALRERLSPDDQTLLVLRVNRKLAWTEIAQVMLHEGEVVDATVLERGAVRLRQRYQVAKKKLRQLAQEAGLVREDD